MSEIIIKLSQVMDDPYGIGTPDEAIDKPIDPIIVPKDTTEPAQDLAQMWQKDMTRLGPEMFIENRVLETLSALKAIGFNMASRENILELAKLSSDSSLLEDLNWMNDQEWAALVAFLAKHNDPRAMSAQVNKPVELLVMFNDVNMPSDLDDPNTVKLLTLLSNSGGQFAGIAQDMLRADEATKAKIRQDVYNALGEELSENVPSSPGSKYITGPVIQDGKPLYTETVGDDGRPSKMQEMTTYVDYGDPEPWKSLEAPKRQPGQPAPTQAPASPAAPAQPSTTNRVIEVDPKPAKDYGAGARAKANQGQEFVDDYEDRAFRVPGVLPAMYGDTIEGMLIFPESKTQGSNRPSVPVKGGDFVRSYASNLDAMVIGKTPDNMLAVRVWPTGEAEAWDIVDNEVRKSIKQYKRKN